MNVLVLDPGIHNFYYTVFSQQLKNTTSAVTVENFRGSEAQKLAQIASSHKIEAVVVRLVFGANLFDKPVLADSQVMEKLEQLVSQAPLHLPGAIELIKACSEVFANVPVILVFETSFFVHLPQREYLYGVDPKLVGKSALRRFGYHGIFHQDAYAKVSAQLRGKQHSTPVRIISICLDDKSDLAAIKGRKPVMVTEGATPLEGLPGKTSCGDIDPSIVLTVAEKMKWGMEEVNSILTKRSGLFALTGRSTTIKEVLETNKKEFAMAKEIFKYKLLNSCGAAIAAMGGLDAIIFSGKYAETGKNLADFLKQNLMLAVVNMSHELECYFMTDTIDKLILDAAADNLKNYRDNLALSA